MVDAPALKDYLAETFAQAAAALAKSTNAVYVGAASTAMGKDLLPRVAAKLGATPMQVALAWLLKRAPNILLIPGTSSVEHLHENLAAANLVLSEEALAQLNGIGRSASEA